MNIGFNIKGYNAKSLFEYYCQKFNRRDIVMGTVLILVLIGPRCLIIKFPRILLQFTTQGKHQFTRFKGARS